ncbi:MAG: YgjV family protein [Clostridia bacterium]|nr:YgjV family protein [Clostridia bacterium]
MEISITYIISQIFTIIMYALLAISYYAKERKKVLILSFVSLIANGIAYILLNAYSGLAMCALALVRNIIFIVDENKNGKREKITKKDIAILIILYAIAIISAIFTYEGFLSLFSIFATMLYTYSVWQKKTRVYKFLGIPIGILWMLYNFYIKSIFGVILEAILFICSVTGYILEVRKSKKEKN